MSDIPLEEDPLQEDFHFRMRAFYSLEHTYLTDDYLHDREIEIVLDNVDAAAGASPPQRLHPSQYRETLRLWRLTIGEWVFRVIDNYGFPRETVGVCINLIDRCISSLTKFPSCTGNGTSTQQAQLTMRNFQLLSTSCLYLAFKASCPEPTLGAEDLLSRISRGLFTPQEIVQMEWEILRMLQWRLRPPTPHVFLHYFSCLLPDNELLWAKVLEEARFSVELALLDYELALRRPSHVTLAALLNAMVDVLGAHLTPLEWQQFDAEFRKQTLLDGSEDTAYIGFCQHRLREVHRHRAIHNEGDAMTHGRPSSPISVTIDLL